MCAAVTGAVLTLVVPVHAWAASNGAAQVSVEAVRYRRRSGGLGVGAICCVVVVALIALVIFLIVRRRRR
jgi:hypothetical protein